MQTSCGSRSVTASNAYAFLQRGNYDAFALCAASATLCFAHGFHKAVAAALCLSIQLK